MPNSVIQESVHNDNIRPLSKEEIQRHWKQVKKDKQAWLKQQKEKGIMDIPYLDFFSYNLNQKVARHPNVKYAVGRRDKLDNVIEILLHKDKNTPMLVGDAGVGKTDIVEGFADAINRKQVPKILQHYQVRTLDLGLMNNNMETGQAGYFNSNFSHIIDECKEYNNRIILFIDEFHMIMGASKTTSGEGMDVSQLLKAPLGRGEIKLIGATTNDEFYDYILPDRALQRRLDVVKIQEPDKKITYEILKNNLQTFVKYYQGIKISDKVLRVVVELAARYITDRYFPDKAFDILDDTFSQAYIHKRKEATLQDVEVAIYHKTNVPLESLRRALQPQVSTLKEQLTKYVKGQGEAVQAVVKAIDTSFTGFNDPSKPIASLLFLGPTGTGKTEMAKALARALFGDSSNMIRLDMASYNTADATEKLLGSNGKRGVLTEAVRRQPYGILLLDEIEKASSDVWDLLLSILDDGEIQDSRGRTVNFKNEIIILTSNLAARQIEQRSIFTPDRNANDMEKRYLHNVFSITIESALKRTFRPELVNRLSNRIVFNVLPPNEIIKIAQKELKQVIRRVNSRGYDFTFDSKTIKYLAYEGTSLQDGARPLQRAIHHMIIGPMSEKIIAMRSSKLWKSKYQYDRTFLFTTTGKAPSKFDRWGSRKLHMNYRSQPLSDKEKQDRANIFNSANIEAMAHPNKVLKHAQQSELKILQAKIRNLDMKRTNLRLD